MSDALALLAAVLASPGDDIPRLVYADFLDERGEDGDAERAEFIRVQCRAAAGVHCVNCGSRGVMGYGSFVATCQWCRPETLALRQRERELWREIEPWNFARGWAAADWTLTTFAAGTAFRVGPAEGHPLDQRCEVSRGFVAVVRGPLAAFWGAGEDGVEGPTAAFAALAAAEPVVRVEVTDRTPSYVDRDPGFPGWRWNGYDRYGRLAPESDIGGLDAGRYYPTEVAARDALSAAILSATRGTTRARPTGLKGQPTLSAAALAAASDGRA